jgi:hypothetical protein
MGGLLQLLAMMRPSVLGWCNRNWHRANRWIRRTSHINQLPQQDRQLLTLEYSGQLTSWDVVINDAKIGDNLRVKATQKGAAKPKRIRSSRLPLANPSLALRIPSTLFPALKVKEWKNSRLLFLICQSTVAKDYSPLPRRPASRAPKRQLERGDF